MEFGELHSDGSYVKIRELPQSAILACPHRIMAMEHYREDGTCVCNDPTITEMRRWGYRWNKKKGHWM